MRLRFFGLCIVLLIGALHVAPAQGQDGAEGRFSLVLRGVPLDDALEELARISDIDLVYSSSLTEGEVVYCDGREMRAEELLQCILADSRLDYVRTSAGTYVLLDARRQKALFGDLAGRIIDGTSGEPLPYANVLLADASVGTTTNEGGFFHFSSVLTGEHRVLVTYVGYETSVDSIRVEGGEQHRMEIALNPSTVSLEPVIIDGLVQRLPSRGLGAGSVETQDLRHASSIGVADVARSAATIAGISTRHPLADLHIQGSGAGEHLTLLDGVPVRDPVTLGRHLSAFSPLAIRRVTVHKAGFGASEGGHLTGVMRLEHDISPQGTPSVSVLVDPISFSGKMQGGVELSRGLRADVMLSARTSLWNVYHDPGLESLLDRWNKVDPILAGMWIREPVSTSSIVARRHHPDVSFSDLHGAARVDLGAYHSFDVSAYRASNVLGSELAAINADPTEASDRMLLTIDDYDWTNWVGQARHTWLVDARSAASFQARASSNSTLYTYSSSYGEVPTGLTDEEIDQQLGNLRDDLYGSAEPWEENYIRELAAQATVSRSLSPENQIDLSLEATHVESRFQVGNQFIAPIRHNAQSWQIAGYAEGRRSIGWRSVLEPGLRLTYLPARQSLYAEPRLAFRYDRDASMLGAYALRVAGGLYRQYIPSFSLTSSGSTSAVPFVLFWLPLDRSLAPPKSYHLSGEALLMPGHRWSFGLEVYHKWQPRLLEVDYVTLVQDHPAVRPLPEAISLEQSEFITTASGRALGANLRISYQNERLSTTFQYAYTWSERRYANRFGGRFQPAPWNEPHRISGSASYQLTSALAVFADGEAAWREGWAFRRAYYDYLALRNPPVSLDPFSLSDPSAVSPPVYHRLNVGLSFDIELDPISLEIRAALVNVLNRENVYDWSLEDNGAGLESVSRTLPGRNPSLSLRLVY